ncbi:MAG: amidophosphoribosyltransferase [Aquificaceae bacterium]|nr:amidophosphoribosyltransferase [Aquificaceae bacterium]MDW8237348.1 amidophosphoribosyltransferase [Aquificaceae bacterium]
MCGVVGVFGLEDAQKYAYFGIYALQHRGQESVGLAASTKEGIRAIKKKGLVLEAFSEEELKSLSSRVAIAHVRYSTAGGGIEDAQPIVRKMPFGECAIAHNGNLVNQIELRRRFLQKGIELMHLSDSELLVAGMEEGELEPKELRLNSKDGEELRRVFHALSLAKGAFSAIYLFKDKLIVARDTMGFRPLVMGRLKNGFIVASESCALDILGAEFWREVKPGEVIVIDDYGLRSYFPFRESKRAMCIFELVYFSKPESFVFGGWVYEVRRKLGEVLAMEDDSVGEIVVPVPDSGLVPAIGYSQARGLSLELGLLRNHYVGRSFIEPTQELRDIKVLMKLNANRAVLKGKSVVVIDDSLVRGTTAKKIVQMLRQGGAKEVHLRIASPPVIGPCYFGIDTPSKRELIACQMSIEEIKDFIGADSLRYLSIEGLHSCVESAQEFCDACFSGNYPMSVELPQAL